MEINNCIQISKPFKFGRKTFAYIDKIPYRADRIFLNHNLKVKFEQEFANPKSDYLFVTISIRPKDEKIFLDCMDELKNKMLILGDSDYEEECLKWQEILQGGDKDGK